MNVDNLDIMQYIHQRIPAVEEVMDVSGWYETEEMTLDFGEYVGRPQNNALMHYSLLTYFFANGWKVKSVNSRMEDGQWESVSESNGTSAATSSSTTEATSEATSSSVTMSGEGYSGDVDGLTRSESEGSSNGSSSSRGNTGTTGSSAVVTRNGGAPYWYAYQSITLERRKMKSELVLKDMIKSFTDAYNEGRKVNNERYDELVALYALMLGHTENELNAIPLDVITESDFTNLADEIAASVRNAEVLAPSELRSYVEEAIANVRAAIQYFKDNATPIPANWLESRTAEINRQFDNKIAQARAKMVADNTYNGTVWPNVESGFERDRQYALTDLADTMVSLKVDVYGKIAGQTADAETKLTDILARLKNIESTQADIEIKVGNIRSALLESAARIIDGIHKRRIGMSELRNTVLKWMFDFMERREDDYPGLDQLATIADRLGYADGAVGGSISS